MSDSVKCLIVLSLAFTLKVYSYSFTTDFNRGYYWPSFPLKMQVFISGGDNESLTGQLVQQSIQAWEDAIGVDVFDIPLNAIQGGANGNSIRWSNNFGPETGYDPNSTLAITIRRTEGPYLGQAEIILNGSLQFLRDNTGNILYKTLVHEFGHVLGLDHSDQPAIMQAIVGPVSGIMQDDQNGGTAIVNETLYRQESGFIGIESSSSSGPIEKIGSCGSLSFVNDAQITMEEGEMEDIRLLSFVFSLLLGVVLGFFARVTFRYAKIKAETSLKK